MNKKIALALVILVICLGYYIWRNDAHVNVVNVHKNEFTIEILVNQLPISESSRIEWWLRNKKNILDQYDVLPYEKGGPDYITIFAFGDGYKEEGKEDRLCFDDMKPPRNCIDKEILMSISRTREGRERFSFSDSTYILTDSGIVKPVNN